MKQGQPWQPLRRAERIPRDDGLALPDGASFYKNDQYTVTVWQFDDGMTHLSIRRNDRAGARDWRHFQRIKNELCGDEREAVELYPAESRLLDAANQYHLWVLPTGQRFPFGFNDGRFVGTPAEAVRFGARQRVSA